MIQLEKKQITQASKDYLINMLDKSYVAGKKLSQVIHEFEPYEITMKQRNQLILQSQYNLDDQIVSMLTLFGG